MNAVKMKQGIKRRRRRLTSGRALKYARVAVSLTLLALSTTLFITLTAEIAQKLHWVAAMQIMPLAMAGAATGIMIWILATLMLGRVYCSWICPMGVVQDIFARLNRLTRKRRFRHGYSFEPARNKFRYTWLTLIVGLGIAGISTAIAFFDPYSAFGRIGSELLRPAWQWVNREPMWVASWLAFAVAIATLVLVAAIAWRSGRLICNTVCPVGSLLSIASRYPLMHFDIDTDVCVNCGLCNRVCKSKCIDLADHVVDASRCVVCFNCVDVCHDRAIRYTFRRKQLSIPMMQPTEPAAPTATSSSAPTASGGAVKIDRRQFLATGLILAATPMLAAVERRSERIAAIGSGSKPMEGLKPAMPPGRKSVQTFLEKCTGCGLCVAHCPTKVLSPSAGRLGWTNMLHPVLDFDTAFCRYNCTNCTDLCPTGALLPLTIDEKHKFVIGTAVVEPANCIGCGLCAAECPRTAIKMKTRPANLPGPGKLLALVDSDRCIGCGACQNICPAKPIKAIGVNGAS